MQERRESKNAEDKRNRGKIKPVVRALIKPARLPLKSLKTSSTVRDIGCGKPSIFTRSCSLYARVFVRTET